jgi:mediator of RNA polymerase II transcription subunit 4
MAEIVQNSNLGTRRKLDLLLQEMDTICREIISQLCNPSSSSSSTTNNNLDIQTLIDMFIERQDYLTQQSHIVRQQQELERQLQIKRDEILKCDRALRCLQTYLLQAVQVLSSAVYQAREKLANIRRAKTFPSETIIRYAYQLASCYSTIAPDNWQQGDIRRPYPTNIDMRRGLLGHLSEQILQQQQQQQLNIQNPSINTTTVVDLSASQNTSSSYTSVTTAVRPPKHDTTSFASDIFSTFSEETNNINFASSDVDSDDDLL